MTPSDEPQRTMPHNPTTESFAEDERPTESETQSGHMDERAAADVVGTVIRTPSDLTRLERAAAGVVKSVPGYDVSREIARGGMGIVYAARDLTLDREVAIKIALPGANTGEFAREARIAARLPHPGIPPVHQLGELADGRPFLAMKLIRGETLEKLLRARPDPVTERGRFVAAFEHICQAVGYAHAQGIIHRDLKPANVMVGAFGEVQVMDWGLAKALREVEAECAESTPEAFGSEVFATVAGQVKGTPAYMAPEQARGEEVDARADVFALGGILCAILTGRAPFIGTTVMDTVRKAAAADLGDSFARLDACGADEELVVMAKRCLMATVAGRYATGEHLATVVAEYRASVEKRLRRAERNRAAAEARAAEERNTRREAEARAEAEAAGAREQRRRRRTQVWLIAAAASLLGSGLGFVGWSERRAERASAGAEQTLAQLPAIYRRGQWKEAKALLDQAALVAEPDADEELRGLLDNASRELRTLERLDEIRLRKAFGSNGGWDASGVKSYWPVFSSRGYPLAIASEDPIFGSRPIPFDPAAVLRRGPAIWVEHVPDKARRDELRMNQMAQRLQTDPLREHLLVSLDDWLPAERDGRVAEAVAELVTAATGEPWRRELRGGAAAATRVHSGELSVSWSELSAPALASLSLMVARSVPDSSAWAIEKMEDGLRRHPSDFWLHLYIGQERLKRDELEEAVGALRAAVAIRPEVPEAQEQLDKAVRARSFRTRTEPTLGGAVAPANTPSLPFAVYRRAANSELKSLQTCLGEYNTKPSSNIISKKRATVGASLLLAAYGEALGDASLRDGAVKIAQAVNEGDITVATKVASTLAIGNGQGVSGPLPKTLDDHVRRHAVMSLAPNIIRDRDAATQATGADGLNTSAVELLGVRFAVLNAYLAGAPNNAATKTSIDRKEWERMCAAASEVGKQLAEEASKGKTADAKKISRLLTDMNGHCKSCHNRFR